MIKVTTTSGEVILGLREITAHIADESGHPYQSDEWWKVNFKDRTDEELLEYVKKKMYPEHLSAVIIW
jgi:hypothetical protein